MKFDRKKDNKWILQKNISSKELMIAFLDVLKDSKGEIDHQKIIEQLKKRNLYTGRSRSGSTSTMGVRASEMCFYMFGYKQNENIQGSNKSFLMLSATSQLYGRNDTDNSRLILINLFSMQYPTPFSQTPDNFRVFAGRLIIKLLLETKLGSKLYIDEMIWFLPFIQQINEEEYMELVNEILLYRRLNYDEKLKLFVSVKNSDDVFSNTTHEINYYFLRAFEQFSVLKINPDKKHNDGKLFSFKHGNSETYRTDAYKSRAHFSGFVTLSSDLISSATKLLETFSAFDKPSIRSENMLTKKDWIRDLYEFNMLDYIDTILKHETVSTPSVNVSSIRDMIYQSKYGSQDGKSFEYSLESFFNLFRESRNVEIISGAGDTDILCIMGDSQDKLYKINIDAKTTKNRLSQINPIRITNHLSKNGSKYCMIVSPRFARGADQDIRNFKIVTVEAETLATYCLKECLNSSDGLANYSLLDTLISDNLGQNITRILDDIIENMYGL